MPEFVLDTSPAADLPAFESLPEFVQGYIEAAFFTSTGSADDGELEDVAFADLAPEALARIVEDCNAWELENLPALEILDGAEWDGAAKFGPYDRKAAGRDFWFTRNGHGVGFWDRGFDNIGGTVAAAAESLDRAANAAGEVDLCLDDAGRVWCHP